MSKKEIRVLILGGAGYEGRQCTRYLTNRGATVVGATGRNNNIGEDIGELAGIGPIGVKLEKREDLVDVIERTKPDIAVHCTDDFHLILPDVKACLARAVNSIVLGAAGIYPFIEFPKESAELDALAKESGVSVIGLGVQDVNHINEPLVMSSNCQEIESIYGENLVLLEYCGPAESELMGIGLTEVEYFDMHKDDLTPPNAMTYALYLLADELDLHVTGERNLRREPILADEDFTHSACGTITKGLVLGQAVGAELTTEEGITLTAKFIWSYAQHGEGSYQLWRFKGDPDFEIMTPDSRGDVSTSAAVANRLAEVISARPGYITVKDLPKPQFKVKPLPEYLD